MKNKKIMLVLAVIACSNSLAQTPLGYFHVFDTLTDADSCYLFSLPKPCFYPDTYQVAPGSVLVQEYVTTDTVTVYGVALTLRNTYNYPIYGYSNIIQARLMNHRGPSSYHELLYSMQMVDTVTLYRSHPRFCWFTYKSDDECPVKDSFTVPCYELYFDTPAQINRVTDTFYVGLEHDFGWTFQPMYFGGRYDNSLPSHIYTSLGENSFGINSDDYFSHETNPSSKIWGIAFPIIGFRCGPVKQYWLEEYGGNYAIVRWRSTEEGTLYNVRLVGDDGSDTTVVTPDTVYVFNNLSDSVRYNVMLRRQCHYATSNYDTTVHSDWASSIYFGTSLLSTVWRTVTVGVNNPHWGAVNGGGVYADSSTVTLIAGAYEGYAFDAWNDGVTDNPRQVLVTSDTAFTAIFRDVEDTVGIMRPGAEGFTLRPNPAHGTVQIQLPTSAKGGLLTLCDLTGRELEVRTVTATTMEWDVSALPAGAYLIKLTTPQGSATKKLTVSR